jgi:hypothetical protein
MPMAADMQHDNDIDTRQNTKGKKIGPQTFQSCGPNPIQGELEETNAILMHCSINVLFFVVITLISFRNNVSTNRLAGLMPSGLHLAGFNAACGHSGEFFWLALVRITVPL